MWFNIYVLIGFLLSPFIYKKVRYNLGVNENNDVDRFMGFICTILALFVFIFAWPIILFFYGIFIFFFKGKGV